MFAAALFIIAQIENNSNAYHMVQGQTKCGLLQTSEYYSAIKRNEHATTWMKLKFIISSKRSRTQKATYILHDSVYDILEKANL